jgi:hypothetical protein
MRIQQDCRERIRQNPIPQVRAAGICARTSGPWNNLQNCVPSTHHPRMSYVSPEIPELCFAEAIRLAGLRAYGGTDTAILFVILLIGWPLGLNRDVSDRRFLDVSDRRFLLVMVCRYRNSIIPWSLTGHSRLDPYRLACLPRRKR